MTSSICSEYEGWMVANRMFWRILYLAAEVGRDLAQDENQHLWVQRLAAFDEKAAGTYSPDLDVTDLFSSPEEMRFWSATLSELAARVYKHTIGSPDDPAWQVYTIWAAHDLSMLLAHAASHDPAERGPARSELIDGRFQVCNHHITNSIIAIHPYMTEGVWVFDDAAVGLREEPFIAGADIIIERMVADIPDAKDGFTLLFSGSAFPGHQLELKWVRADMSGNWYRSQALGMEGWLCPALLKYFESPPARLYAQFCARGSDKK